MPLKRLLQRRETSPAGFMQEKQVPPSFSSTYQPNLTLNLAKFVFKINQFYFEFGSFLRANLSSPSPFVIPAAHFVIPAQAGIQENLKNAPELEGYSLEKVCLQRR
ncbi:MAG: hypothetical protein ACRCYP_00335 [Alphaproteobacteria bacterium]